MRVDALAITLRPRGMGEAADLGQVPFPQAPAGGLVGVGEADDEMQSAREGRVEVAAQVGGQHRDSVELFHALQEVGDLLVRVPVLRVLHLGP